MNTPSKKDIGRRDVLRLGTGALGALAVGGLAGVPAAAASPGDVSPRASWVLKWNPSPSSDGLNAFEGLEDDRADSHPDVKHIYVEGDHWRFDMHTRDRDTSTDRQRNESKGMRKGNTIFKIQKDQTWRITYQMYMPSSLTATEKFSHIFQIKVPDVGGPLVTMTLRERSGPKIEIWTREDDDTATLHSPVNLTPLQNKWIDVEWEVKASNSGGYLRWVLRNGGNTVVDYRTEDVDMWRDVNYLRPKWGIYRSVESSGLQNCYLLTRNYRGYQWQ